MLISALKPKDEIRSAVPSLLIDNPTIDNFRRVLVDNGFLTYIKNSFVVSLAATLISMIIAVLAGYALSRYYRKRIVKTSNFMMMLSQMIPGVLLLVPLYMIMQQIAYAGDAHFSGAGIHHVRHSALHLYDEQLF